MNTVLFHIFTILQIQNNKSMATQSRATLEMVVKVFLSQKVFEAASAATILIMMNASVYVLPLANSLQISSVYVSYMYVTKCLDAVFAAMISPCSFQKHFCFVIS